MTTPFRNQIERDSFLTNGFCHFPLLSENQLEVVRNIYEQTNAGGKLEQQQFYGVNYSLGTLSAAENERLMQPIIEVIQPSLQNIFTDFEVLGSVFITKPPHTSETFVYHQDWSYTDELYHSFATCWIPLYDTPIERGCMNIINGSHLFFNTYRSDTLHSARIAFESIPQELRSTIEQKAGSCLAFHQAAFHGSHPNNSSQSRPVLAFVVKHKSSPIVHYVKQGNRIAEYQLSLLSFSKMLTQIPKSAIPPDAVCTRTFTTQDTLPNANNIVSEWRKRNPNHRIINDENIHHTFQQQGYAVIPNVVSLSIVTELRKLYEEHFTTPAGMYVTHHNIRSVEQNQFFSNKLFGLIAEASHNILCDTQNLVAHYAAKGSGNEGLFNLHQDWSIIEEQNYGVLHCWIPLQDVSETNGTLAVLPGSHLCFHNYRSGTCPIRFLPIDTFKDEIVNIKADVGDAVIYHPALFHGSGINKSQSERIAVVAAFAHQDAQKVYYHRTGNRVIMHHLTNQDLFSRLDDLAKGQEPIGEEICEVPFRVEEEKNEELIKKLKSANINHAHHVEV